MLSSHRKRENDKMVFFINMSRATDPPDKTNKPIDNDIVKNRYKNAFVI